MEVLRIALLCVVACVLYGIVHDQITARVCVEYFTIGHDPIFPTESPTVLGFMFGILGTWWVGLMLSVPLSLCARGGSWPTKDARWLVRPIALLMVVSGVIALISGCVGYAMSAYHVVGDPGVIGISRAKVPYFIADYYAHVASYRSGYIGGAVICGYTLWARYRSSQQPLVTPVS